MTNTTLTPQNWAASLDSLNQDVKPRNEKEYSMLEQIKPHHLALAYKATHLLQHLLMREHGKDIWTHRRDYYTNEELGDYLWKNTSDENSNLGTDALFSNRKQANGAAFMANQLCDFEYGHVVSDDGSEMEEVNFHKLTRTGRMVFLYLASKYGRDTVMKEINLGTDQD